MGALHEKAMLIGAARKPRKLGSRVDIKRENG